MLVLTRRTGETIVIGDDIRITVTLVRGDRVQLGITAPESVRVARAEIYEHRLLSGASLPPTSVSGTKTCTKLEHPAMLIPCPVSTWEVLPCVGASPRG
jgi:carbon storage regulator